MFKRFFLILIFCLLITPAIADSDTDEWTKHLDVYNSDGLDRPVNAIEYKKTMDELQKLKEKNKNKKRWWQKKDTFPDEPLTKNEPIKIERDDIVKITTPLYFDGQTVPVGFYKISCKQENNEYYFDFLQGKNSVAKIKAQKTSHLNFCPDKVTCLETKIYQNKYFKINYKTIDYAVTGYLAIIK